MPFIHLQFAPAPDVRVDTAALAQALTRVAAELLHKKPEVTAVRLEPVEPAAWFIGGYGGRTEAARREATAAAR